MPVVKNSVQKKAGKEGKRSREQIEPSKSKRQTVGRFDNYLNFTHFQSIYITNCLKFSGLKQHL
jgi:hypothetical protein